MKTLLLCSILILLFGSAGCMSASSPPAVIQGASGFDMTVTSKSLDYPVYVAAPATAGKYPGIVLIHSFNGLEPGYRTLVDRFAAQGYVVIAPQWQTFNKSPSDGDVSSLVAASTAYLKSRPDVDPASLGLTGFCAADGTPCSSCPR
jgi:carboxymethylenebutenolidase